MNQDLENLEEIEQALETKRQQCEAAGQDRAAINVKLKRALNRQEEAQEEFLAQGGKLAGEQTLLAGQLQQVQTAIEEEQRSLQELAAGTLPLHQVQSLLEQAQKQGAAELEYQQRQGAKELLSQCLQEIQAYAEQLELPVRKAKKLQAFLQQQNQVPEAPDPTEIPWLHVDKDTLMQLDYTLKFLLTNENRTARRCLTTLTELREIAASIEGRIAAAAAPET